MAATVVSVTLLVVLMTPCLCRGQSVSQTDPSTCPLAPVKDVNLDQVLISVTPQGCLRELVGADLAPCFYRQSWFWDGSKARECVGVSVYQYATITGFGNPQNSQSTCPSSGVGLGFMEAFITASFSVTGQAQQDEQNVGVLANMKAVEDCAETGDNITDQTCRMTLDGGKCTLIYEVQGDTSNTGSQGTTGPTGVPTSIGSLGAVARPVNVSTSTGSLASGSATAGAQTGTNNTAVLRSGSVGSTAGRGWLLSMAAVVVAAMVM